MEFHAVLRKYAALPAKRRRLAPLAWILAILWFVFALGPGAVIGNTLFGDPNDPSGWLFGMPSIWTWQIVMWADGVVLMWFLAYHLGLSTAPDGPVWPLAEDIAGADRQSHTA